MILLHCPTAEQINDFRAAQAALDFTYAGIGCTAGTPPAGYVVDETRTELGGGASTFRAGCEAIRRWEPFRLKWVQTFPPDLPVRKGEVVAIMAHVGPFWWLNAARVVYVLSEDGPVRRFGFAYGTLPDHVESGEERFLVEWNRHDDSVWYTLRAFSRPRHWLARLGYPLTRRGQRRFARDSADAMRRATADRLANR